MTSCDNFIKQKKLVKCKSYNVFNFSKNNNTNDNSNIKSNNNNNRNQQNNYLYTYNSNYHIKISLNINHNIVPYPKKVGEIKYIKVSSPFHKKEKNFGLNKIKEMF